MDKPARPKAPGELIGLLALGVVSALLALVLGAVAAAAETDFSPSDADVAVATGAAWWSDALFTVAVVSLVGVIVLAGVRRLLASAGFFV